MIELGPDVAVESDAEPLDHLAQAQLRGRVLGEGVDQGGCRDLGQGVALLHHPRVLRGDLLGLRAAAPHQQPPRRLGHQAGHQDQAGQQEAGQGDGQLGEEECYLVQSPADK